MMMLIRHLLLVIVLLAVLSHPSELVSEVTKPWSTQRSKIKGSAGTTSDINPSFNVHLNMHVSSDPVQVTTNRTHRRISSFPSFSNKDITLQIRNRSSGLVLYGTPPDSNGYYFVQLIDPSDSSYLGNTGQNWFFDSNSHLVIPGPYCMDLDATYEGPIMRNCATMVLSWDSNTIIKLFMLGTR